jgi:hypothetical protein
MPIQAIDVTFQNNGICSKIRKMMFENLTLCNLGFELPTYLVPK